MHIHVMNTTLYWTYTMCKDPLKHIYTILLNLFKNNCMRRNISNPKEILVCKSVLFHNVGPCFVFLLLFRWYFNDLLTSKSFSQMSLDGHRFADEWHQMVAWSQVLCFLTIWSLQELHSQKKHVRHTGCMGYAKGCPEKNVLFNFLFHKYLSLYIASLEFWCQPHAIRSVLS